MEVVRHRKEIGVGISLIRISVLAIYCWKRQKLMMVAKVILPSLWGLLIFFAHGSIFYLLQHFGGVPISDHVLTVSDGVLQAPRNSRYEVAAFIMSDLREAVSVCLKKRKFRKEAKEK